MTLKSIDISLGNLPNAFIRDDQLFLSTRFLSDMEYGCQDKYFGVTPHIFGETLTDCWGYSCDELECLYRCDNIPLKVDRDELISFLKTLDPDIFNKSSESDNTFTVELPSCSAYFGDK